MDDAIAPHLRYVVAGKLQRGYFHLPSGEVKEDIFCGSAVSAAAGVRVWEPGVGIIARIDSAYPQAWIEQAQNAGLDTRGIRRVSGELETRYFEDSSNLDNRHAGNPVTAYAEMGLQYPKSLLGYQIFDESPLDNRTRPAQATIRQNDIPTDYADATAAHICPLDFLSHVMLPMVLRGGHVNTVTLDAGPGYMDPAFYGELPVILHNLSAFLCNDDKISRLFMGRSTDLWEMAEDLTEHGCGLVVIKRGATGQYLYERETRKRWMIPAYPIKPVMIYGAGDAFGGGFLAGLRSSYDPLTAVLHGSISASFAMEGISPLYALDVMPGLAAARLESLREKVRLI